MKNGENPLIHEVMQVCLSLTSDALKVIYCYLSRRKHRTIINTSYSLFDEILFGASQRPVLQFLGFYYLTFTYVIFFYDIDDNPPYSCLSDISVLGKLERGIDKTFECLQIFSLRKCRWMSLNSCRSRGVKYRSNKRRES